jgi:hypothetical protein
LGFKEVFDYVAGKADWLAYGLPTERPTDAPPLVGDRLRDVPTCGLRDPLAVVKQRAYQTATGLCVVVSEQRIVLGLCAGDSLPEDAALVAEDIMESGPRTLRPSYDGEAAAELLRKSGKQAILVTSSDGKLMGIFTP